MYLSQSTKVIFNFLNYSTNLLFFLSTTLFCPKFKYFIFIFNLYFLHSLNNFSKHYSLNLFCAKFTLYTLINIGMIYSTKTSSNLFLISFIFLRFLHPYAFFIKFIKIYVLKSQLLKSNASILPSFIYFIKFKYFGLNYFAIEPEWEPFLTTVLLLLDNFFSKLDFEEILVILLTLETLTGLFFYKSYFFYRTIELAKFTF